jgi:hypothetical protein
MAYRPSRELRECFLAARAGDPDAARLVLKLYRYEQIAREVKKGRPFSNRVRRAIDCLTAGYGTHWEVACADGSLENLVATPPPPPTASARLTHHFDD